MVRAGAADMRRGRRDVRGIASQPLRGRRLALRAEIARGGRLRRRHHRDAAAVGLARTPVRGARRGDGAGAVRAVPSKRGESPGRRRGDASRRYRRGSPALALHVDRRPVLRPVLRVRARRCARGARGAPGARGRRGRCRHGPARRGLGARGIAGTAIGRRGGHAVRDRIGDVPHLLGDIRRRTRRAGVLERRVGVQPTRMGGVQGSLRHAPRDMGRAHRRRRVEVGLPRGRRRPPGIDLAQGEHRGMGLGPVPRQGRGGGHAAVRRRRRAGGGRRRICPLQARGRR